MRKNLNHLLIMYGVGIATGAAIVWLIFDRKKDVHTQTTTVINNDTTRVVLEPFKVKELHEKTIYRDSVIVYPPGPVDTAQIIKSFFTARFYEQTIRDTVTKVEVTVSDSIFANRLSWREVSTKNLRPTSVTTTTTTVQDVPLLTLYGGMQYVHGKNKGAAPILTLTIKNLAYVSGGYDVINNMPSVSAGVKINLKN